MTRRFFCFCFVLFFFSHSVGGFSYFNLIYFSFYLCFLNGGLRVVQDMNTLCVCVCNKKKKENVLFFGCDVPRP